MNPDSRRLPLSLLVAIGVIAAAIAGSLLPGMSQPTVAAAATCDPGLITGAKGTFWEVDYTDGTWEDGMLSPGLGKVARWDAFDGYGEPYVNGNDYNTPNDTPCIRSSGGRELTFPENAADGISWRPALYFDAKRRAAREIVTLRNVTKDPVSFQFRWNGDLGSDTWTNTAKTSNGDDVATAADVWATSCEDEDDDGCAAGPAYRDPEIAHIWEGPKGPHDSADFVELLDNATTNVRFDLTLEPGERISLMHWAYLTPTIGSANKAAKAMADEPSWLFGGLTKAERKLIANW